MKYSLMAEAIAREAHKDQKRFGGEPYIVHPERIVKKIEKEISIWPEYLAKQFNGELDDALSISWLHDVVKDTDITTEDLVILGMTVKIAFAVNILTRYKEESYVQYLKEIKKYSNLVRIKIFDIEDNLGDQPTSSMVHKYNMAKYILSI